MRRIAFKTFGCKANMVDTDILHLSANRRGFEVVPEESVADVYIINTCTVTSNADRDARSQISRFKRQNPQALVGVVGCYAQVAKEELLRRPEVDFVVGTAGKEAILDHIEAALEGAPRQRDQVIAPTGFLTENFPGSRYARANIKIQDGCNFKCSFCIIPEARGRSRSLPLATVLRQIDEAHAQGFEEVVLTGIHLAHYGWDQGTDLQELVNAILERPGPRLRLSTLDPFEIPDSLIQLLGTHPRLCPHLHIALQSGSDDILKAMRRIYKTSEFVEVTEKIAAKAPDTFMGVDVIVGFPGETAAFFEETLACLQNTPWAKLHVFSYSSRAGTAAAVLKGAVDGNEIARRSSILRDLSDRRYQGFLQSQVGGSKQVLLERTVAATDRWLGHTENYLPVEVSVAGGASKNIVPVRLLTSNGQRLSAVSI